MNVGKLEEIRDLVAAGVKSAVDHPDFLYDLDSKHGVDFMADHIARHIYALVDVDYFRRYRLAMLKNEVEHLKTELEAQL